MALSSQLSRCLSITVLSCALGGALVGCGQTGPLYLPPEPDEPDAEIDTVVGAQTGAEQGLEAGIEAGREGDLMENTSEKVPAPEEDALDSDVIIETVEDDAPAE